MAAKNANRSPASWPFFDGKGKERIRTQRTRLWADPRGGFNSLSPLRQSAGVMESMKSQTPSTKSQTNLKFQYWSSGLPTLRAGPQFQMTKTQNRFGISNFGHCDLFDICDLLFGISIPLVLQDTSQSLPARPLNSDLAPRTRFSILNKFNFLWGVVQVC